MTQHQSECRLIDLAVNAQLDFADRQFDLTFRRYRFRVAIWQVGSKFGKYYRQKFDAVTENLAKLNDTEQFVLDEELAGVDVVFTSHTRVGDIWQK